MSMGFLLMIPILLVVLAFLIAIIVVIFVVSRAKRGG